MRKLYKPNTTSPVQASKNMSIEHNVTINIIDEVTGQVVQSHEGHNAATNTLLLGIGHYLIGDGVNNQATSMLSQFLPRYISLGTMGLLSQDCDEDGLPVGLGGTGDTLNDSDYYTDPQTQRLCHYISQAPGFGSDGYDVDAINNREYFGLGPMYPNRLLTGDSETDSLLLATERPTINCELISPEFARSAISFREIVPESEAEIPKTIDVIFSAMISTGALNSFREPGRDYIFITEAGLWSSKIPTSGSENGLLAGYRIVPPSQSQWNLGTYVEGTYSEDGEEVIPSHYELDKDPQIAEKQKQNQEITRKNILRVNRNQIVQVIWKIQLGGLEQLGGMSELYPNLSNDYIWHFWDD